MGKKENIAKKKGYKHPNLGLIPYGWEVHRFADVFEFLPTNSFSRDQMTYGGDKDSIYNIHYGDIHATFNEQILDFNKHIHQIPVLLDTTEVRPNDNAFLKDGDLIIADASEDYDGVGECIEITGINKRKVLGGLHTITARDLNGKTIQGFRAYLLKNQRVFINLKKLATGSKVYGVSKGNVAELELVVPPIHEQQKIARILSTWDKAIEKTEQLIDRKQQLKKGLMQQLLTGKVRFKEFSKVKWKNCKLGEVCEFTQGVQIPYAEQIKENKPGYIRYLYIRDFFSNQFVCYVKNIWPDKIMEIDEIMMVNTGNTAGKVYSGIKGLLSNNAFKITFDKTTIYRDFIWYFLTSESTQTKIKNYFNSAGQPHVGHGNIALITFPIVPIHEQKKISNVIAIVDNEIVNFQEQLKRLQLQKRGLMQKLLTGQVRVKLN
jgi:type I restriction enzyme, S subunit